MTPSLPSHLSLRAALITLVLVLGAAGVPGVQAQAQAPADAPTLHPAERIIGRVERKDGSAYEGALQLGALAAWGDRLTGRLISPAADPTYRPLGHPDDARVEQLVAQARAGAARTLDFAGTTLTWQVDGADWDRDRLSVPLSLVAELRPDARGEEAREEVELTLHSGEALRLELDAARLGPEGLDSVVVIVSDLRVPWHEIAVIELHSVDSAHQAATTATVGSAKRLTGTVEDREGRLWSGLLTLSGPRVLASDTLDARRRESGGVGSGPGPGFRTIRVTDPALGEVIVPGSQVREVRFDRVAPSGGSGASGGSGSRAVRDAPVIVGRVALQDGTALEGQLIWDADEAYGWQTLDGRLGALRVAVAFEQIARIRPMEAEGVQVLLRDGRLLTLTGGNDVDRRNAGVIVLSGVAETADTAETSDASAARWVPWGEVAEVVLAGGEAVEVPELYGIPSTTSEVRRTVAADAYDDEAAARLHAAATARWSEADTTVERYTAVVKQRTDASLRTPLRDRTLFRSESAARVFWHRDHESIVQVLGSRAEYPGRDAALEQGDLEPLSDFLLGEVFDPGGERLFFGFADGDGGSGGDDGGGASFEPSEGGFWIAHPLAPGADTLYRFASRDTTTVQLPDGRALSTVRLNVMPRVADPHRVSATLWLEAESGALVRAAYRVSETFDLIREIDETREAYESSPLRFFGGALTPWTLDLDLLVIDYLLWDFSVWMPRSFRFEGRIELGVVRLPVRFDLAYGVESVVTRAQVLAGAAADGQVAGGLAADSAFATRGDAMAELARLASREGGIDYAPYADMADDGRARSGRFLLPANPELLATSPELPSPIGTRSAGFVSDDDADQLLDALAEVPRVPWMGTRWRQNVGLSRYNRVEGSAIGALFNATTGAVRVGGAPLDLSATAFVGLADRDLKARLTAGAGLRSTRVTLGAYRELQAFEPLGRPFGFGNSFNAALFGRDDGEYFRATGVDLALVPGDAARPDRRLRLYAERHTPVTRATRFALVPWARGNQAFRDNLSADAIDEFGAELGWSPWWGAGVGASGFGLDLYAQGATTRRERFDAVPIDSDPTDTYARARLTLRGALPLSERWKLGLEGAAGHSWGQPALPVQRQWVLGGPATLRGYAGTAAIGPSMARARVELGRGSEGAALMFFGDAGWAGDAAAFAGDDVLWAVGIGGSVLEGLLRADLSRGLTHVPARQWRLDLYVDGLF